MKNLLFIICLLLPTLGMAYTMPGVGGVAQNMMEPVTLFSDFVNSGCLLIGGSFIFASIIKFVEHRRSPLMTPLSTPVFLLIAGIVLVLLPLLSYVTQNGIPYSLLK